MAGCGPSAMGLAWEMGHRSADLGRLEGIPAWHPWALGLGLQSDHPDSSGLEFVALEGRGENP